MGYRKATFYCYSGTGNSRRAAAWMADPAGDDPQRTRSETGMDLKNLIAQMEDYAQAIRALAEGVPDDEAIWNPEPDAWSILDVINHLAYEETYDFRDRLDLVLHRPQEAWPRMDPARGVTDRSRQRELGQALKAFLAERDESLAWLKTLEAPDWDNTHEAPFGQIKAGDVLAAWVAHDLLHLRQLIELRYQLLIRQAEPYGLRYAGSW
jgi:hypothetical protein